MLIDYSSAPQNSRKHCRYSLLLCFFCLWCSFIHSMQKPFIYLALVLSENRKRSKSPSFWIVKQTKTYLNNSMFLWWIAENNYQKKIMHFSGVKSYWCLTWKWSCPDHNSQFWQNHLWCVILLKTIWIDPCQVLSKKKKSTRNSSYVLKPY